MHAAPPAKCSPRHTRPPRAGFAAGFGVWYRLRSMDVDVVIVAAGASTRFGAADKLTAVVEGATVLARSVAAFVAARGVGRIVVVAHPDRVEELRAVARDAAAGREILAVAGGARRRDSVEAGVRACTSRYVAIHDGARPLVTPALIERCLAGAEGHAGAIAAIPVTDTVKEVRGGTVSAHPDRSLLWAAQTPQVVLRQAWLDAAGMSDGDETDDAAMLSRLGLECRVVEGDIENIKITQPLDLEVAAAILRGRERG